MKHIHFLGIGGSGASAIASIAQAQGYEISGCDKVPFNEFTKVFDKGILLQGHSKNHLKGADLLIVTPAIFSLDPNNEELQEAKSKNIPIMTWQEFMGKFLEKDKFVIAICGTHGKSTTTAMVGLMLEEAGFDPTVELGAIVPKWGTNYRIGKSRYFVTEADEFNNNFMATTADIALVTAVEMDHPEYFKDFESYKESFDRFLAKTRELVIANISDPNVGDVMKYVVKSSGIKVVDYSRSDFNLHLKIPGKHNILNAQAVFQLGLFLGIEPSIIRSSLENFSGIGRRLEYLGDVGKNKIYSDFAHHPTEIAVTVKALKDKFPKKSLTVIFQPHMFSRTRALFADFVKVFQNLPAEQVFIEDIYPSREIDTGLVSAKDLVEEVNKPDVKFITSWQDLLSNIPQTQGIILFMGAGDIDSKAREWVNQNQ